MPTRLRSEGAILSPMRKLTLLTLTTGVLIAAMTLPGAAQSRATVTAADIAYDGQHCVFASLAQSERHNCL